MLYSGTDPEPYIIEYTTVYEDYQSHISPSILYHTKITRVVHHRVYFSIQRVPKSYITEYALVYEDYQSRISPSILQYTKITRVAYHQIYSRIRRSPESYITESTFVHEDNQSRISPSLPSYTKITRVVYHPVYFSMQRLPVGSGIPAAGTPSFHTLLVRLRVWSVQGNLAHEKQPPPLEPP
jgi:hypothetical protein